MVSSVHAKNEKLNTILVCQLVQRHESTNTSDQITVSLQLPEHCTRLDTSLVTATNTEQLFIQAAEFRKNRNFSGSGRISSRRGSQQRDNSGKRRRFVRSPGGSFRPRSSSRRSQSPGKNKYQKSSGQSARGYSNQRATSKHGRRYSRSPGGKNWVMSSRSPTPRFNQDTRGRSGNPATQTHCIRCGGNHESSHCRIYNYHNGDPCAKCGLMHPTQAHRARSSSATRAQNSRVGGYESILVPADQSLNPVNFLNREMPKN